MSPILIVYPQDNILTNPTMVGLLRLLAGRGVPVDVMTPRPLTLSERNALNSHVVVTSLPLPSLVNSRPTGMRTALRALQDVQLRMTLHRYAAIVGVDPLGIAIAARLNATVSLPLVYVSFELIFESEVELAYEIMLKAKERAASLKCDLILIQDEARRDIFCRENAVDPGRCVLVPVSPVDAKPPRTNYLRERLGIAADTLLVLYQGSLADWSCRNEFEELVSYWRADECLVIHSRDRPGKRMARFLSDLMRGRSIYFTSEPVSPAELSILTASADVGLVCYRVTRDHWCSGDNLRHLGLSSGKVGYYAMCGLPILSRSISSLDELIACYQFGASYDRLSASGEALQRVRSNRYAMGLAARSFYESRLEPSTALSEFCDRLLALKTR